MVCRTGLEVDSRDQLHGAEAVRGGSDGAEAAGVGLRIRGCKYRVIGQIVGFKAQFEAAVLAEGEALDDVGIQLVNAIGAQVVEGGREGTQVVVERVGGLGVEGRGIERGAVDLAVVKVERRAEDRRNRRGW